MPEPRDNRIPQGAAALAVSARRHAAAGVAGTAGLSFALAGFETGALAFILAAAALFALGAAVARPFLHEHAPNGRFGWANRLTLTRGAVTATLGAAAVLPGPWVPAALAAPGWTVAALAALCLALDGADGWTARRFGPVSAFGARIDRELDALFTLVLAVLIWRADLAAGWVLAAGVWRYLHFLLARLPAFQRPLPPSTRRRAGCALAQGALVAALVPALPAGSSAVLAAASVAVLSASFLIDIAWAWHRRHGAPEPAAGDRA